MKDILDEMAKGKSTSEIGTSLGIASSTVGVYKSQMKNMAGVKTDVALMNWFAKNVHKLLPA
jgi:DNA-binding CsgD family transcriptional regulator